MENILTGKKRTVILTMFYILIIGLIVLFVMEKREEIRRIPNKYLSSVDVVGYELDKVFTTEEKEYTVIVEENKLQINCETNLKVEGCNELIDITGKENYQHEIKLKVNGEEEDYKINIINTKAEKEKIYAISNLGEAKVENISSNTTNNTQQSNNNTNSNANNNTSTNNNNQTTNTPSTSTPTKPVVRDLKIDSIEGNPTEWTTKDVTIKVNATSSNGIEGYSFDGGKTWQKENYKVISQNEVLNIVVKDKIGDQTTTRVVKVTKIDKEKPKVKIVKTNVNEKEITILASSVDTISGVEKYSFNNEEYTTEKEYTITQPGKYTAKVIDYAGNKSETVEIEIKKEEFIKPEEQVLKEFTVTFDGNGAQVSKDYLSCTTMSKSCTIQLPKITRKGATIVGWSENSNSTTKKYAPGEIIELTKNMRLYAITYKTIEAKFEKNGADSIGFTSAKCKAYNKNISCNITTPSITRKGTTIVGWSDQANSGTIRVKTSSSTAITTPTTFYAQTYYTNKVTFNKNGADVIGSSQLECRAYNTNTECKITMPSITRNGGTVLGWNANKDRKPNVDKKVGEQLILKNGESKTYYATTYKSIKATFEKNGADTISSESINCAMYNEDKSCSITTPNITRNGGTVLGWNTNKNAKTATVKTNSKVNIDDNLTYYAISKKTLKATFKNGKDDSDVLTKTSQTCDIYNKESSCNITLPYITRNGKEILGFTLDAAGNGKQYVQGTEVAINKDTTFYSRTGTVAGKGIVRNPSYVTKLEGIKNAPQEKIIIEYDSECNNSNKNNYVTALKNIYSNAPYLFRIHKLFVVSDNTWNNTWTSKSAIAMQHGVAHAQTIDIKCSYFNNKKIIDIEQTLVHELAHAMDGYYQLQGGEYMQTNFTNLYDKYKSKSTFSDYSKTNINEFFAEIYRHYYYTFIVKNKNSGYYITNYPDDVKSKLEEYIKIAKEKW